MVGYAYFAGSGGAWAASADGRDEAVGKAKEQMRKSFSLRRAHGQNDDGKITILNCGLSRERLQERRLRLPVL